MDPTSRRNLLLIAAAIALAACRMGERARQAESVDPAQASATASESPPATPEPIELEESSASIEVAIAPPPAPEPTAEPAFLSEPPRSPDDPSRCLTLEASPTSVSAYGASGAAVQLTVRARNGCASSFSGPTVYFRAVAVSMEGSELASATGRFSGEIRPYSTAETLIAIETDPTRVRSWRVELR